MNRVLSLGTVAPKTCIRRLSATEVLCNDRLAKMKQKQAHFQKNDDVPMYLRGGFGDYVFFYTTVALVAVGLGGAFHSAYKLATKK